MDKNPTPLHLGAQLGNLDIVKFLLMNGAYFNARTKVDRYVLPLHFAEKSGNLEVVKLLRLIEKLFKAIKSNNFEIVDSLVKQGVVINAKDTDGWTALHYAVNNGRIDIVRILLTNRADVTQVTNKSNTPLHIAVLKDHKEIVGVLVQHVSNDKLNSFINAGTTSGATSLHVAAKNGSLEIVKSLLKHGAIYNIKNKEDKTPIDFSQDQKVTSLLKLVEKLFKGAENSDIEIISKLKAIKPDERMAVTSARNDQGKSLLQVTIINRHQDLASKLLEILKDPDHNLQDVSVENQAKSLNLRFS
ncbi:MAG: ankyrin repeat domain-containing protein [Wolbachia sp.]